MQEKDLMGVRTAVSVSTLYRKISFKALENLLFNQDMK